jgi:hypothetical protein
MESKPGSVDDEMQKQPKLDCYTISHNVAKRQSYGLSHNRPGKVMLPIRQSYASSDNHDRGHSDVRVFAANAADGRCYLSDRLFKRWRERQGFAGTAIEDRSQLSTEPPVFIDRKDSIPPAKERLRNNLWAHLFWNARQSMERDS